MRNWIVQGVDQETGKNAGVIVQAEGEQEAASRAREKGLLVLTVRETHVDRPAADRPGAPPQLSDSEALHQIAERLEELLECVRPIRYWVTFIGIVVLLSLSLNFILWIIARLQ